MTEPDHAPRSQLPPLIGSWLFVGIPLGYGVYELMTKVIKLF